MLEYGAIYNESYENNLNYLFCAFRYKNKIFMSDALNNRVIIQDLLNDKKDIIYIEGWFPRWLQPVNEKDFIYLDSRKRTVGYVKNKKVINEYPVPMEKPMFIKKTNKKTFLIGGKGECPLIEYSDNFKIVGNYLNNTFEVQSAEYIGNNLLICDIKRHQVLICNKSGDVFWSFGKKCFPGEYILELSTPKFSCFYDGLIYIADGKNNRIICVDLKKEIKFIYTKDELEQTLWWPSCLQKYENTLIITDSANCRIIELSLFNYSSIQHGCGKVKKFLLNNPRAIEIVNDSIFLADTYNNRILKLDDKLHAHILFGGNRGNHINELFWPRAVRYINNNMFLIADSRNSRIVKLDSENNVYFIIYGFTYNKEFKKFIDPHDIDVYNNKILITDSELSKIIEINNQGECTWIYGINGELNDPHNARKTNDGNVLISDTRNNRVIKVAKSGKILYEITKAGGSCLNLPRWSEEIDNNILITDSGNNRVILVDKYGHIIKEYGKAGKNQISIRSPRCARKYKNYILISDTYNNRIVLEKF